jgi:hypothetical protein
MKYTKFFSHFFLLLLSFTLLTKTIHADWADDSDNFLDDMADNVEDVQHGGMTRTLDPNVAFNLLIDDVIQAQNLLKKDFYLTTTQPRTRSILDLDFFQFHTTFKEGFTYLPFFTQTTEMQFRGDKTALNKYIDLQQTSVSELLERLDIESFTAFDFNKVLTLFRNTKMQERRIGLMLQYGFEYKNWNIFLQMPLLYQERNFFMTEAERKAIEAEAIFKLDDPIEYFRNHLISDKIGFGDLRISSEYLVKENYRQFMHFGIDITIPTSLPLVKGLIGTHFNRKQANPTFDLNTLLDLALDDDGESETEANAEPAKAMAEELINNITDRLSAITLERKLGEERHLKIGCYVRNQLNFTPHCYLTTKTKLELGIPSTERRFFRINPNEKELDTIAVSEPETDAEALVQLHLLSDKFVEKFFPQSYRVMVFPGCAIQSTMQLTYERPNWTARLGTDAWYHTKEVFGSIEASKEIRNRLDIKAGRLGHALQTRFWIGLDRAHQENSCFDWGVRISTASFSYGVGQDFALAFRLTYNF